MGYALVQMRLARVGGLPEDVVINTFHFSTPNLGSVTAAEASAVAAKVYDFYDKTWSPATVPVRSFLSASVATTGHETRVYDMEQPTPRAPILSVARSLAVGATSMPSEVALCLSYRGALESGTLPARRRGRIYIGPLTQAAVLTGVAGDARPESSLITAMLNAAKSSLMEDVSLGDWCVASQPTPGGDVTLVPIVHAWVDNAFDTQRRRGGKPTTRTTINA